MKSLEQIKHITEPLDKLPLECDGLTRIINFVFNRLGIQHEVWLGEIDGIPHYWIEVNTIDGRYVVDYRRRMWGGEDEPHGVFYKPDNIGGYMINVDSWTDLSAFLLMATLEFDVLSHIDWMKELYA